MKLFPFADDLLLHRLLEMGLPHEELLKGLASRPDTYPPRPSHLYERWYFQARGG